MYKIDIDGVISFKTILVALTFFRSAVRRKVFIKNGGSENLVSSKSDIQEEIINIIDKWIKELIPLKENKNPKGSIIVDNNEKKIMINVLSASKMIYEKNLISRFIMRREIKIINKWLKDLET